jgi:hypothetical protein
MSKMAILMTTANCHPFIELHSETTHKIQIGLLWNAAVRQAAHESLISACSQICETYSRFFLVKPISFYAFEGDDYKRLRCFCVVPTSEIEAVLSPCRFPPRDLKDAARIAMNEFSSFKNSQNLEVR